MHPIAIACDCIKLEKIKRQWVKAGINPEINNQSFKNFIVWNQASKLAKETAINFYKDFLNIKQTRKNSILFCGQVGSGKTHLSIALALNFLKNNIKVVYMPYRDVITKIKQNMLDEEYYKKSISKYKLCEVLLIDDLFKGKVTDADINIIFEILNYRYINHMPIIVSTEYTVENLLSFDEAIGSRIYEMCRDYIVLINKARENNYRLR